jgi:sulfite exporter TauE/SafE/copper chaperone CopZ
MKKTFKVKGMHCNSCSQLIENALKYKEGIGSISASYSKEEAEIDFDENKISQKEIKETIKKLGYEVKDDEKPVSENKDIEIKGEGAKSDKIGWFVLVGSLVLLAIVVYYFFLRGINLEIPGGGETGSIFLLFIVGILTGFHCVSMCGAFVVSYTTKNAMKGHKSFKQHLVYGGSKVISYAVIGGIFGLIGGIFAFSVGLRGGVAIFAGVFMIFYALSMMGIKFFRRFQINPKFLTKLTSKATKNAKGAYKGPFITGLLSGLFIACGPLQAMYLYAAGTGSVATGAMSLAAFGLGTLPVMVGFGSLATVISH